MSHFNSKKTYEELGAKLGLKGYRNHGFTGYHSGKTIVGFKPYREKYYRNGKHDVCIEGPNSFVKIEVPGYGKVWAILHDHSTTVELLGWGHTWAQLSDFAESEQEKLIEHRRIRA